MRIGIVCYPTYGGSGVLATELGIALAKKGHEIHFISYKRPARLTSFIKDVYLHEVGSYEYPLFEHPPYDSLLASKIVDVCQYAKLDVLHVHYAVPHATVAFLANQILKARGYTLPVMTTLHGTDITLVGLDKSLATVIEFSINRSSMVTTVSKSLRDQTMNQFKIDQEIAVVYNFIDLERFTRKPNPEHRKAFAPDGEKIVVHISNFRPVKRVDDVVRVFQRLREKTPAKLLLVGDGPERINIERMCRSLGVNEDVRLLGKQDAVEEILSIADLMIMPSEQESFGLAALEAMACGVPVVASNVGGLPEVIDDGKNGFLCPLGNVEQMAEKALSVLSDENILDQYRIAGRTKAEEFCINCILPEYEKLYMAMCGKKATA